MSVHHTVLYLGVAACFLGLALAGAGADDLAGKLGEEYQKAAPSEKIGRLGVAAADKAIEYKALRPAVDEIASAEIAKGKSSEERLRILGQLRSETEAWLKKVNDERRAAKKQWVSMPEPDSNLQNAVALAYLADTAGPRPSLQALGCLKTIRECTTWSAHSKLVLAAVTEAIARDEAYAKADHVGKLDIVKGLADRQLFTDMERTYVESAVVTEWMAAQLKAGKAPREISGALLQLASEKRLCFFTKSWAEGILKRLEGLAK